MTPALEKLKERGLKKLFPGHARIAVGMDTCGMGNGALEVYAALEKALKAKKIKAYLTKTGCFGACASEPLVNVSLPGKPILIFSGVKAGNLTAILHYLTRGTLDKKQIFCKIEQWDYLAASFDYGRDYAAIPQWYELPFFKHQKKIVLRNCGLINPEEIDEYLAVGGYSALFKTLKEFTPLQVVEEVKNSKLRGRGGAGFPTGRKRELLHQAHGDEKYIICNADEGDPGAYMNRNEIESDPHTLIEGMSIGAFACGASKGVIYVRAEYPLAVERLKNALNQARKNGILGNNIGGTKFNFDIDLVEGAGAFVCGEETALMASIESQAGRPRPRPPFPAEKGLFGKPTTINNVETWYNIPVIINKGAGWFTQTGTEKSAGTKVFSLVGKIKNTGLVELPLGSSLQTLVYNIGEGTGTAKRIKAVQSGGPSGGCIPAEKFNTPIDYESLASLGAIMGSGGMVVMDDDNCMVDVARYFTEFTQSESCGKCTPCREGLCQELNILKNITAGKARPQDLRILEELADVIKDSALCGLGQTAPNPVLTTLHYFADEYTEHIQENRCRGGVCKDLFMSPCENSCPLHMNIPGFLELFKEGRFMEAFDCILRYNPLPASTGRICHFHCRHRCRREDIDTPVSSGELHRYIADTIYKTKKERSVLNRLIKEKFAPTGKKIAVVGAGPAGLNAAYYLSRLGHKVTVYEAKAAPGGVLRYGIPAYRLPREVLAKEIDFIKAMGVRFIFNKNVKTEEFKKIVEDHDAVFTATGAYEDLVLGIPGEHLKGVILGTHYLKEVACGRAPRLGKEVVIIGAGNVAVDAARTALRFGSRATIVYRRGKEDMPANKDEISEAEREGIKFVFLAAPKEILGDAHEVVRGFKVTRMTPGDYDFSGRKAPVATNETFDIDCDTVILAVGERAHAGFLGLAGLAVNKNGTVKVNPLTMASSLDKIYAGGDLVSGPATAVEAMADGCKAAAAIDYRLTGNKERYARLFALPYQYKMEAPATISAQKRWVSGRLPVNRRKGNFKEVSLGLIQSQAMVEAIRCLRCDIKE